MTDVDLPVPVTQYPHWRVLFRPESYERERIARLADCLRIVERSQVRLRGWDFPHVSHRPEERGTGENWVASWSSFMGHLEYWRFYQSTQFVYLGSVRESTEPEWDQRLRREAQSHFGYLEFDVNNVPGFFSIRNFIYTDDRVLRIRFSSLPSRGIRRSTQHLYWTSRSERFRPYDRSRPILAQGLPNDFRRSGEGVASVYCGPHNVCTRTIS
jgi:hypothetical protein